MTPRNSPPGPGSPADGTQASAAEAAERGEAQVYRPRSLQSRVGGLLPLGIVLVLGVVVLGWYYSHVPGKHAMTPHPRGSGAGTGQDVPLPSLGRIDPPVPAAPLAAAIPGQDASSPLPGSEPAPLMAPLPLAPAAAQVAPPAVRSPAQIALERRLSGPAFEHQQSSPAGAASGEGAPEQAGAMVSAPVAGLQAPVPGEAAAGATGNSLGGLLVPTATPAARARELPTRSLLLAKGTFIDCTLETAVDSSLPGMTTCITATDTFGVDGKVVLLERGSKLVGETRGQVQQGASRLFVLWTEARTPSGVVVPLASPGTDELGRAGVGGEVERHFWQRFGAAILISVVDGGLQAAARSGSGTVIYDTSASRDVATEALRASVGIGPTLIKPQGDRIQVLVARDLDFRSVYELKHRDAAGPGHDAARAAE